ncbi:MAG TPA: T9SS type A sorting domain-containing protein, partial [Bacteroidia bacterium]|nr:T9SS type A sorting domain-containing protein [Bacteroidia bacterium]
YTYTTLLIKTDSSGNEIWAKKMYSNAYYSINSVMQSSDSGYVITGWTNDIPAGSMGMFVMKTYPNGNTEWSKRFNGFYDTYGGGAVQTPDGDYLVAANYGTNNSHANTFLVKLDAIGDTLWTKYIDFPAKSFIGWNIIPLTDGNYLISGMISFPFGYMLAKIDSSGTVIWLKGYGCKETSSCIARQTSDNGFILCGYMKTGSPGSNNALIIKTDANGDTLWTKIYGNSSDDAIWGISETPSGGYIGVGFQKNTGAGLYDGWIIGMDSAGNSTDCDAIHDSIPVTNYFPALISTNTTLNSTAIFSNTGCSQMGRGLLETSLCPNGISEIGVNRNVFIYPNPFDDQTTIEIKDPDVSGKSFLLIYDVFGNLVRTIEMQEPKIIFEKGELTPGIYLWKLENSNPSVSGKFIIR